MGKWKIQYTDKDGKMKPQTITVSAKSAEEARAKFRTSHPGRVILEVYEA